ncbi:MAG: hypothetical protein EAX96_16190 [Candidatus Lokiarchaeota archaeon]|nr:hypothetical protein [Candidatus Lokiarchaeota archaeon]
MSKGNKEKNNSVKSVNNDNSKKRKALKTINVDFWITALHGAEIGIRQQEQWQSKSRAFSKDMEIIGDFSINSQKMGFFAIREDEWKNNDRLVIRLFKENDKSLTWLSSIEECVSLSLAHSLGANEILPSYLVIQGKGKEMFPLEKVNTKLLTQHKMGEVFVFFLEKKKGLVDILEFKEKRFTIGCDYEVNNHSTGEMIAFIDSKKFNIGGKVEIEIYDPTYAEIEEFINIIVVFAASLKYHDEINKKLESLMKEVKSGHPIKVSHHEMELFRNPRRVRS